MSSQSGHQSQSNEEAHFRQDAHDAREMIQSFLLRFAYINSILRSLACFFLALSLPPIATLLRFPFHNETRSLCCFFSPLSLIAEFIASWWVHSGAGS